MTNRDADAAVAEALRIVHGAWLRNRLRHVCIGCARVTADAHLASAIPPLCWRCKVRWDCR